jgi:hypothetical protein
LILSIIVILGYSVVSLYLPGTWRVHESVWLLLFQVSRSNLGSLPNNISNISRLLVHSLCSKACASCSSQSSLWLLALIRKRAFRIPNDRQDLLQPCKMAQDNLNWFHRTSRSWYNFVSRTDCTAFAQFFHKSWVSFKIAD